VRYTPGIKILLARHAIFSFFISLIPSLMPVVGLKELDLPAARLGFLFTKPNTGSRSVLAFASEPSWNASNASHVRKITSVRWPARHGIFAFSMNSIGYADEMMLRVGGEGGPARAAEAEEQRPRSGACRTAQGMN
jgi:hypothetical protein